MDGERLVATFEARLNDFEKKMGSAVRTARRTRDGIERETGQLERNVSANMAKVGTAIASKFLAPLAALGVAGSFRAVGDLSKQIAQIGDEASRAGLGVEAFQEMAAVAKATRVPVDALVDGIKELNLRGDEFVFSGGKSGSAAEAFTRLGYTADELSTKLKDPSALFTEIIGKLGQLDRAAQIRIADEIFGGTGGEKFVQLIAQGESGMRSTIQSAHDLGQVMDAQVIAKANDLDRAFGEVADTVSTNLQQAIVNASYALFDFLQQFKAMEDRTTTSLESRLDGLGRDIVAKDFERNTSLNNARTDPGKAGLHQGFAAQLEQEIADLRAEEAKILTILEDRKQPIAAPIASVPPVVGGAGKSSRDRELIAQARAYDQLLERLQHEHELIGMTAREMAVANALREGSVDAMSAQGQEIERLVLRNFDLQASVDDQAESMRQLQSAGQSALESIIDGFLEGKDAGDIFKNVLADIGKQLLSLGTGGFGNLLSGALGGSGLLGGLNLPRREFGGPVTAGQPYIVGEKRPEVFVPNQGGHILPRIPSVSAQGGGDTIKVEMPVTIDARGADMAVVARIEQVVAKQASEFEGRVKQIVRDRFAGNKWR